MRSSWAILFICILSCNNKIKKEGGLSPDEALKSFELPEGFQVELLAAEPLVSDPVAMEVDEKGDIYVVEMHGYPEDLKGSGIVKLLKDTDGDGEPDQAMVFADSLVLPSGIMKWKKGILVVDVPDVWYLEDTNGDGRADRKERMLTGFARTNPQHIANTPLLGIDNWIYIAHQGVITPKVSMQFNDTGSAVRYAGNSNSVQLPRDADGRTIRFRPDTYELEMLAGESQYGHTFDTWGHHISTSNANHLFHEVIAAAYLKRNPSLLVADAIQNIPDHGNAAEVFPITTDPQHQLLTDVGVITSSCGVTWYQGGLFPDSFNNVTFIAEPVHNLVHADRIQAKGSTFSASRVYKNSEFLASRDAWFRPVQFYIGPDGALYVIDYYRQIVEHPEWMSDEVNKSGALYNGSDKGRIYRIAPKGTAKTSWISSLNLGTASNEELIGKLADKNIWWRRHAQRLLADRNNKEIPGMLAKFIDTSRSSAGLVHALWLMHSMDRTDSALLLKSLQHPVAGVRENAIRISEAYLTKWPGMANHLFQLKEDPDPRVRYQLLCSIGSLAGANAEAIRVRLLLNDIEDKWVQVAMLTATSGKELSMLANSITALSFKETAGRKLFIENCAAVIALSENQQDIKKAIDYGITDCSDKSAWWQSAILDGLLTGLSGKGKPVGNYRQQEEGLHRLFAASTPRMIRKPAMDLLKIIGLASGKIFDNTIVNARGIATDSGNDVAFRQDAINLLSLDSTAGSDGLLEKIVRPSEPEDLQKQALKVYASKSPVKAGRYIIAVWKSLSPAVRDVSVNTFFVSTEMQNLLLDAIETGQIQTGSIGWQRSVWLMNEDNPAIRNRARKLLANKITNRMEVIKKYEEALSQNGNAKKGQQIFAMNCASCHQVNAEHGTAFGPDLASIRNREPKFILTDILDPNRSIADTYESWTITRRGGEKIAGIIVAETSVTITVKNVGGQSQTIPRSEIDRIEASAVSAMPVGLESAISINEMANLLAFLKVSSLTKE